jgi:predicted alpha-1,6-mannanase (GH76 family)
MKFGKTCSALLAASTLLLAGGAGTTASAFTNGDASTLLSAFHSAFYYQYEPGKGRYKAKKSGGDPGFWQQAEIIESMESGYQRTGLASHRDMVSKVVLGFTSRGTLWSNNSFNDDIMWACIAFLRGYELTGNTTFRTIAKNNFDMCYARAWDSAGGLWWTTGKTSKTSAVNGPGSIAAHKLYTTLGDSGYRTKAIAINNWQRANCFNESNGQVYDSPTNHTPTTYNQGTFIMGCYYRGSTGAATLACNYIKNNMGSIPSGGSQRLMPVYGNNNNNSGFNSIAIRYATQYMKNMGMQSSYLAWLQANAQAAWNRRRTSDNLSWQNWHANTDGSDVGSWDCVNSMEALQVVPPTQ